MTRSRTPQTAFSSGEIDPLLHAREDFQRYQTGLAICRGFVPMRQGGFTRAPGTLFRGSTRDDAPAVLVPFVFAQNDATLLEFSANTMRVWRYGALVETGGSPFTLATPFGADDLPNLRWVQDADVMYLVDGRNPMQQLSRLALDNWTLEAAPLEAGPFRVQNLDENRTILCVLPALSGATTIWRADEALSVGALRQNGVNVYEYRGEGATLETAVAGVSGRDAPAHATGTLGVATEGAGGSPTTCWWEWKYSTDGPGLTITLQAAGDVFRANHVGALFLLRPESWNDTPIWVGNANLAIGSLVRFDGQVYEVGHATATGGNTNSGVNPPTHTIGTVATDASKPVRYRHVSNEVGVVRITAVTDANTAAAVGVTALPPPLFDDPTYRWSEGAWTDEYGHPAHLTFHEQRLFAAGNAADPRTIYASETGAYRAFLPGGADTDSFAYDIGGAGSRNAINWLCEGRRGIYIGSLGEVRRGHGGRNGDAIGPATFRPEVVSRDGSAAIEPALPYGWPIYVTRDKARVMEVRYNFSQDEMSPLELSLPSQHLGQPLFEQIVWQAAPEQTGWLRRADGTLVCLIYDPEQDILGWSVVPLAGGFCEHLAVSPSADGAYDIVTAIVCRSFGDTSRRYVEDLANNVASLRAGGIEHVVHGYAAVRRTAESVTETFSVPHLAGKTVAAWTDRGGFTGLPVAADGIVTLPEAVGSAVIGLFDESHRARTLPLRAPARDGDSRGRERAMSGATVQVYRTAAGTVRAVEQSGTQREHAGHRYPLLNLPAGGPRPVDRTGTVTVDTPAPFATELALQFEPEGLAPLTILSVIPTVEERGA